MEKINYLEPHEIRAIIAALPYTSRHAERDSLLFELLWQSGARVSEALALRPEWIGQTSVYLPNLKQVKPKRDNQGRIIRDKRGFAKQEKNSDATKEVEVTASLCQRLKDFCNSNIILDGEFVFKPNRSRRGHLSPWYVWWIMDKSSTASNIIKFGKKNLRTGGRYKGAYPHLFRHSNAMKLLEETGDLSLVQEQLGHASIKTTQIYATTKRAKIRREIAKIDW